MATTYKWEVFRETLKSPAGTGTFDIADSDAIIDFAWRMFGMWVVIYHVGATYPLTVSVGTVAPPTACFSGIKVVTTATTDVVLGTSQALKSGVQIKAYAANTGVIYIGPEGVAAATGYRLNAGEAVFIAVDNVADVWMDSSVNGEGVSWVAS